MTTPKTQAEKRSAQERQVQSSLCSKSQCFSYETQATLEPC